MIDLEAFIAKFYSVFAAQKGLTPWAITGNLAAILTGQQSKLSDQYQVHEGIAIHKTAIVETGAILKAPVILCENCFVSAHATLRGGVYAGPSVTIGPGCEIKSSIFFPQSSAAHFNFIGDSIIGSRVNFEAGAIIANHHNDRTDKNIAVVYGSEILRTGVEKFGALVGDDVKIGANAVLSPGTLLIQRSMVGRLELVDQQKNS